MTKNDPGERLLRKSELAAMLQVSLPTVNRWVSRGNGPRHIKVGALVRFRLADVHAYLDARTSQPEAR